MVTLRKDLQNVNACHVEALEVKGGATHEGLQRSPYLSDDVRAAGNDHRFWALISPVPTMAWCSRPQADSIRPQTEAKTTNLCK
jgi:hypothetical protein